MAYTPIIVSMAVTGLKPTAEEFSYTSLLIGLHCACKGKNCTRNTRMSIGRGLKAVRELLACNWPITVGMAVTGLKLTSEEVSYTTLFISPHYACKGNNYQEHRDALPRRRLKSGKRINFLPSVGIILYNNLRSCVGGSIPLNLYSST